MKKLTLFVVFLAFAAIADSALGQTPGMIKRTIYKNDKLDFGAGGTLDITGAPVGSISIEGTASNSVEISATIELQAASESDLSKLSEVTGFVLDESLGRVSISSTGTNDKKYVKLLGKRLPTTALGLPFRIDYAIKVPRNCDLQINGGSGDLSITGVEGALNISFLESNAKIDLVGGSLTATIGKGSAEISIASRSWRGRFIEVQLASGQLVARLPAGLNAEVDATILREGKIDNSFDGLKPRVRKAEFTDKQVVARAGVGGIALKFTVGDGTLSLARYDGRN